MEEAGCGLKQHLVETASSQNLIPFPQIDFDRIIDNYHLFYSNNNFIMEAIILGSRSINQDKLFQKDQEEKYKKHRLTLGSISKEK